ncbi:MAG TPA: DUF502 domain-containing protein [Burkholderiales bacterium]|jgi:uncharacterized membrane protein|nr:DUF502 domain-containing protein [Burkholderiales bacterium]
MAQRQSQASGLRQVGSMLAGIFLRGVVVILPIGLTLAVLVWLVKATEHFLGGIIRAVLPGLSYWPGLGIVLGVALIFAAGLLVSARIARLLLGSADALLAQIPVVKTIYVSLRDVAELLSGGSKKGLGRVVAVKVQDMRLIGFVTTEEPKGLPANEKLIGVYLPMSYGIGGYTVYLPGARVEPLDLPLEDAMRITMSGGVSAAAGAKETLDRLVMDAPPRA